MTTLQNGILILFILVTIVSVAAGLECWKCVSHDCQLDPVNNYKARKMKCNLGESCMKVRYRMYDNKTAYDSVIRTCSSGPCHQSNTNEFKNCVEASKQYMVLGCSLRSCCSDTDLCNFSEKLVPSISIYTFVCVVLMMCKLVLIPYR